MEIYGNEGYPEHLIQTTKEIYKGLIIRIDRGAVISSVM
jgi:hypothetical protein